MAKPYGDDLRRKILEAYQQREGTEEELARRFRVSQGYVEKIRSQQLRTGQMERVPHRPGRKPKFTPPVREQLRDWLGRQPDLTLAELQEKLLGQVQVGVSLPSLWTVLKKMGLRLKKSRSTPSNATRRRTVRSGQSSSRPSPRSRRRG